MFTFFQQLTYVTEGGFTQDVLKDMYKHRLPKEWHFYFHTLHHCFAPKKGGHAGIANFSHMLGYTVAHNLSINFGKLILDQIIMVMGPPGYRDIQTLNVECFYPRFLQLILNDLLTDEEK